MTLLADILFFFRTKTPDASGFKLVKPQRQRNPHQVLIHHQKPLRPKTHAVRTKLNEPEADYKAKPVQSVQARQATKRDHSQNRSHDSLTIAYTCSRRCWAVLIISASLRLPNGHHCCNRRLHLKIILAG